MSAVQPIELPIDESTKDQLAKGERGIEAASRRTKKRLTSRGATIAAVVIAVLWTIPTFGLFVSSFRPEQQVKTTGWWTIFSDFQVTIDNYVQVLQAGNSTLNLAGSWVNSIAIAVPATLIPLVVASLAAYAFAWIDFRGKNFLFILVFALQVVPIQMALVPLLSTFSRGLNIFGLQVGEGLDASGTFAQVWIAHTMFALPLAIFLLHNFVAEIPGEVIEAARVDGAGHGQIFFRIVLPLTMPAIASFAIFQFLWVWNDLLVALIFADGEVAPITKLLAEITGTRGNEWHLLTAGAFISILVPLVVFFALQRYFVRGLLAGSTKG
ncbi:carbohydrate ABC transporter permease [Plantibacter sp. VKM Ac-2885]|jgi:alpha-glucoside transport system permease protein|uniref:Carbohydrate ABC transporter membrane protein 2 (CUT1 family) n=2 Tax=Plantibacter TaxID=190323 RepID=A0A3N2C5R7_9MICO|nr:MULTISPECIES: carbohydrate ABC transporter permease [Plantibacter]AZH81485.1 carbohydrate ABC transporter permease [Plantibacter sp. PA-3-X8]MBD8104168.1 carbohydrate ABC transporter permease [Plantibacter sp. CFBP 8775]MBD8467606.1 carbohydrate ABC transporter permease [Plantibacter sp. CFBP 8798]MBD8517662.1 carbohydrate ABC transporter permease [Plantibacter sp. CFBP 8804]MBD8535616.1 carbohydrate ABC transporter permease [Plantibacter sp. CFBP 13570]